jgi:hypothetical protein
MNKPEPKPMTTKGAIFFFAFSVSIITIVLWCGIQIIAPHINYTYDAMIAAPKLLIMLGVAFVLAYVFKNF